MKTNTTPIQFGAAAFAGDFRGPVAELSRFRGLLTLGVFFAVMLFLPTTSSAADRWEILQAIHLIENPTNSLRVGRSGELGPYQFRPSTWKMHTKKPFHLAANREEADRVAVKHYEWIRRGLERAGVPATTYRIALAWNAGLSASLRADAPRSSHDYASRVEAVATELQRRQVVRD